MGGSVPLRSVAAVNFQGFLYVIGRKIGDEQVNCVHRYNPDTNL